MDTETLIKEAKARFHHQESKQYLAEKYKPKLAVIDQGGMWPITIEVMAYLKNSPETVVLLDAYDNPLSVNAVQLLTKMQETYTKVMNDWHQEWLELSKNR